MFKDPIAKFLFEKTKQVRIGALGAISAYGAIELKEALEKEKVAVDIQPNFFPFIEKPIWEPVPWFFFTIK